LAFHKWFDVSWSVVSESDEIAIFVTESRVWFWHDFMLVAFALGAGRFFVVSVLATPKVEQFEDYATTGNTE